MKLFTLALALASPLAHAGEPESMYCHSTGVADAGFELRIDEDRRGGVIAEQSFMGPRNQKNLVCRELHPNAHPDEIVNTLVCREEGAVDGGLVVRLYEGGIVFQRTAQVLESTVLRGRVIETPVEFGRLVCPIR